MSSGTVCDPLVLGEAAQAPNGRDARLAFWINAYNALVLDGLGALGIRGSVRELPDFFGRIGYRVGGLVVSADEIEHGVLRGNRPSPLASAAPFGPDDPRRAWALDPPDPRVHFAISCGARSCPAVRRYAADAVDDQLEAAAHAYVNREVTLQDGRLTAPEIFWWFATDFVRCPGGLAGLLARYLDEGPARRALLARGLEGLAWRSWDWRLAGPPAGGAGG